MSRKDYEFIAGVIRNWNIGIVGSEEQRAGLARAFASELLNTNKQFNTGKFLAACGMKE